MRRSAITLPLILSLAVFAGCKDAKKEQDPQGTAAHSAGMQPDYFASDPAAAVAADDYGAAPGGGLDSSSSSAAIEPVSGQRSHVVAKGDTLFSLARQYYQDERRWKDIYAANGGQINNPDVIYVGQVLVIP